MAKLRLLTSVAVMVAMLMAALPATAFAHDDEVGLGCTLAVVGGDPGTDVVDDNEVTNSDASFTLLVLCPEGPGDLSGFLVSNHGSEVEVDPVTGEFSGEIEGTFVLYKLDMSAVIGTGELEADVDGLMFVDGTGPVLVDGNVITVSETIDGDWELEGFGFEAEGEFGLDLDFSDFMPFGGVLKGEIESEYEEEEGKKGKKDKKDKKDKDDD